MKDTFRALLAVKIKFKYWEKQFRAHYSTFLTMFFVLYIYFPSVCIYTYYLRSLFNMFYMPAVLHCERSHSDEERLSFKINFSSAAFKCCPTEEKDVDSNFSHAGSMGRNWTASLDSSTPEQTVAVHLHCWMSR